jgi:pantothenate kinase
MKFIKVKDWQQTEHIINIANIISFNKTDQGVEILADSGLSYFVINTPEEIINKIEKATNRIIR